jgi:tetratricopeptide (TPR) repeat protein
MLASVAATLLIAVGIYHFVTPATQNNNHIKTAQNNNENTLTLTQEEHLFAHDAVLQEGVVTLTMLEDCVLSKKENKNFIMKNGKVRIKVLKGNNTLIHINDEFLVRVLGTEFIVSAHNHHLDVSVVEGMVEVVHLGTNEVKTLTKNQQCHYDFETPQKLLVKQETLIKPILPVRQKLIAPPIIKPAPTGTLLERGRIALEKGDSQKALKLFNSALHQKEGADKALFEIIRIYEGKKEYKTILTYLNKHQKILNKYKTYREEFFIKGCNAQSGLKSGSLSFCTQYLKLFPEGYKRNEIEKVLGDRK